MVYEQPQLLYIHTCSKGWCYSSFIHPLRTIAVPELLARSSNVGAARKVFPLWSPENKNTSLFIIISYCFTVRLANQLAFRVM